IVKTLLEPSLITFSNFLICFVKSIFSSPLYILIGLYSSIYPLMDRDKHRVNLFGLYHTAVEIYSLVVDINCEVRAGLFSASDRCFPRARLQPPRETHSAGSSDTCYSRRSQRSSAPNNHRNSESELYSTVDNRTILAMVLQVDSCGKAKTMRPRSERSLRVRRLIASPWKA